MSLFGVERSNTAGGDIADHAIDLVDTTRPQPQQEISYDDGDRAPSLSGSVGAQTTITRQSTRTHLRKELARRKYAKWQDGKEVEATIAESDDVGEDSKKPQPPDIARKGRLRDRLSLRAKKKPAKRSHDAQTFVDVLYENQRGWWLCGIPLYSSNSLLNFDPAAWQTSTFHDSPVNITNAQVPDPSWQWAWRHWYVDMSYDVDEEGWQYSFSFNSNFAWHGNHPWYHSYVRRRRWLRKRVKKDAYRPTKSGIGMADGHHLNPDYFTIHPPGRDSSRESSADRGNTHRSSVLGAYTTASETDDEIEEVENTSQLLAALRKARVDREKIAAVRLFLEQGGEELHYLAETMPTVLDDFVHQSSRRQLLLVLRQRLDAAKNSKAEEDKKEGTTNLIDNLQKALQNGRAHAVENNYWTDHGFAPKDTSAPISSVQPSEESTGSKTNQNEKVDFEIRDLPGESHFAEPHIGSVPRDQDSEDEDVGSDGDAKATKQKLEKGKAKA